MLFQGKPGPAGPLGSSGTIGASVSELFPSAIEFTFQCQNEDTSYFRRQFFLKFQEFFSSSQFLFSWGFYTFVTLVIVLVRFPCRLKAVIVKDTLHLSLWLVVVVVSTRICPLLFTYNLLTSLIVSFREELKSR